MRALSLILVAIGAYVAYASPANFEQVHVSLGDDQGMYVVSWVSHDEGEPSVLYGDDLEKEASGDSLTYSQGGYKSGYIHHVQIESIPELHNVSYQLMLDDKKDKNVRVFQSFPAVGADTKTVLSIVGDLGQTIHSDTTMRHILEDKDHHVTIIAGDLSYADSYQPRWDSWGKLAEPLVSAWPLMVAAGNHEVEKDDATGREFVAYQARFRMPAEASGASNGNLWYSFEVGSAHVIILCSYDDFSEGSAQYKWLKEDLGMIDRETTPWVIAVLHAPWYNSNDAHHDEDVEVHMRQTMEPLLHAAKVDYVFAGHVHAYERMFPVYNNETTPGATTFINIGDGGNREGIAHSYINPAPAWSAVRGPAFGHGKLELFNATHSRWTWHKNDLPEWKISDESWVIH